MADKPSFWHTLPGILTGLAAVVGAVGALVVGLHQAGLLGQGGTPAPPSEPAPMPAPGSTPTPAPAGFRIVDMTLRADPFDYRGPCPVRIEFSGRISVAGGGGTVSYKFLRSDGANAPVQTAAFDGPGSQGVKTTWQLGGAGMVFEGWQQIQTFDPEERTSPRARFSIRCE